MLYLRQLLIIVLLLLATPSLAVDPFSLWLIGKGADKALDMILPDTPPPSIPPRTGERVVGAGVFSSGAWETVFGKNAEAVTVDAIRSARKSIIVASGNISSRPVASALKKALESKVKVLVVGAAKGSPDYTPFLARSGVPVRLFSVPCAMEFMVIDGKSVQVGLPHSGALANILRIKDVPEIARVYAQEWKILWDTGRNPR